MGLVQALEGISKGAMKGASGVAANVLAGKTLPQLAEGLIARHSPNNVPDTAAINGQLAELATHDPAFAADLRAEVSAQLRPVDSAGLSRAEQAAEPLPARDAPNASAEPVGASRSIEALRTSPDPADRTLHADLARAAGSGDPVAIRTMLVEVASTVLAAQTAGQTTPGIGNGPQTRPAVPLLGADAVTRLIGLLAPAAAGQAPAAGLNSAEWRGQLQVLLDMRAATVATGQEARQGMQEGSKAATPGPVEPVVLPYAMGNLGPALSSTISRAKDGADSPTRCRAGFAQPCPRPAAECHARRCGETTETGAIAALTVRSVTAPASLGAIEPVAPVGAILDDTASTPQRSPVRR
ncbi:hypothetical protein LZK98_19365 [Sphingomonas cannabina]|uniref:hypothetical protein n=1 Tax=Sphingomonas cannabina TaxID=2899123 RepID=UPI001F1FD095|nr:hypothetical protein [Sphingomonas cannabina]UIJ45176.1 hypothetical protein LZK98_19365 [Sphingomonas cannabina]